MIRANVSYMAGDNRKPVSLLNIGKTIHDMMPYKKKLG